MEFYCRSFAAEAGELQVFITEGGTQTSYWSSTEEDVNRWKRVLLNVTTSQSFTVYISYIR